LYCPGSGQELLSAFGVTIVCHDSNVFLIWKLPLSIKEVLLKSKECSRGHAWLAILEPLATVLTFLMCSFLRVLNALPVSPMNSWRKEFCKQHWFVNLEQDETSDLELLL